jgi:hypothetical protein
VSFILQFGDIDFSRHNKKGITLMPLKNYLSTDKLVVYRGYGFTLVLR